MWVVCSALNQAVRYNVCVLERMYEPWMDDATVHGLVRLCGTDDVDQAREQARTLCPADAATGSGKICHVSRRGFVE